MTSDSVEGFRQCELKQKDSFKLMLRRNYLGDREKTIQNHNDDRGRKLKSSKKFQESKTLMNDIGIKDVFLNSAYFKHQSINLGSLSFCSGNKGEHRWTIDSTFEMPSHPKTSPTNSDVMKNYFPSNNRLTTKENQAHLLDEKLKSNSCSTIKNWKENSTENIIPEISSENGKIDKDLLALITEQMFLAEKELQITRTHLIQTINKLNERDLEIIQLREKLKKGQKTKPEKNNIDSETAETSIKSSEEYQKLNMASEKLQKQVRDMEEFLNDYGLVWIGNQETNSKQDFDKIIKNFEKLNSIASQPKIIQTSLGAKFELPRGIPVVLYANGILLKGTDFREYSKFSTTLFLQDIEDGYFPSELQTEYPEGVPFEVPAVLYATLFHVGYRHTSYPLIVESQFLQVVDKRNEVYDVCPSTEIFKGTGIRLGSNLECKPASVVFLQSESRCWGSSESSSQLNKSSEKKCPKKRLRIHRENESRHGNITRETDNSVLSSNVSENKCLTLKIRYGKNNTELFTLQVNENDKLSRFYESLQRKLCERYHNENLVCSESNFMQTDFEVHVYGKNPFRLIENLQKRLKDCGIIHNCVLNVWEI